MIFWLNFAKMRARLGLTRVVVKHLLPPLEPRPRTTARLGHGEQVDAMGKNGKRNRPALPYHECPGKDVDPFPSAEVRGQTPCSPGVDRGTFFLLAKIPTTR